MSQTAEDGPVKLTVGVDRDVVAGTDRLTFTLAVEAERGVQVKIPKFEDILGDFAITGSSQGQPTEGAMTARVEHRYTLEGVLPGDRQIPPVTIEYVDDRERADGSKDSINGKVTSKPIVIKVDTALAGMKDPANLPRSLLSTALIWMLGVIAAMTVIALLARWRKRRRPAGGRPAVPRVAAHVWALAELEKLVGENLPGAGRVQEFYYRINGLIRRYIEMRFGLMASEQTSEEFIRASEDSSLLSASHKGVLREFTNSCDPVKYAALPPDREDIAWVRDSAEKFIRETAETTQSAARPAHVSATEGAAA